MNININSESDKAKLKEVVNNEITKLEKFFDDIDSISNEETLFTIETDHNTWYIDFDRERNIYKVFKNEKYRRCFALLGEALEYVFETLGGTRLKLINRIILTLLN